MENVDAANPLLSSQHKQSENSQIHREKGIGRGNRLIKGKPFIRPVILSKKQTPSGAAGREKNILSIQNCSHWQHAEEAGLNCCTEVSGQALLPWTNN